MIQPVLSKTSMVKLLVVTVTRGTSACRDLRGDYKWTPSADQDLLRLQGERKTMEDGASRQGESEVTKLATNERWRDSPRKILQAE